MTRDSYALDTEEIGTPAGAQSNGGVHKGNRMQQMPKEPPAREPALAAFLRYRLDSLEITPEELIRRSGVSRSTIFRLLGGRPPSIVSTEILMKLADTLDVDATQLAALWHGTIATVDDAVDEREQIVRAFVLANSDLSDDELRSVLEVARVAAQMSKRPTKE